MKMTIKTDEKQLFGRGISKNSFEIDLSHFLSNDMKIQLIDFVELIHNKGILALSLIGLIYFNNILFIIPLLYGMIFDLEIKLIPSLKSVLKGVSR